MALAITVIIPCHNASATIERAVKSAIDAGATHVYAFNDASTDATRTKMERLWDCYPQFHYLDVLRLKSGVSFGRNYAIKEAPDGLIIPLDADDELLDIYAMVNKWQEGTWVYGDCLIHKISHGGSHPSDERWKAPPSGMIWKKPLTFATMCFHKRDWMKAGGYDTDFAYAEDYAFQCALTNVGVLPVRVDSVVYKRYVRQTNERTEKASQFWAFYYSMAKAKYPQVFTGNNIIQYT